MNKRAHIFIRGDVVGVGFRSWIASNAKELKLTGWVKNADQRLVEAVIEGSEENVKQMVERCNDGPEVAWVEKVDVQWEEVTDEFEGFEVE
ncbi:acylphosphatase [Candidatus Gottesmanbacteria bacterium]|nr:acylphosphatase [Candidatus Gottesmanbacteria bacterium]